VFCASLSDVFEDWDGPIVDNKGNVLAIYPCGKFDVVPDDADCGETDCRPLTMDDVRRRLFDLIDATPNLDWLLLTKRPENIQRMWPARFVPHPMPGYRGQSQMMKSLRRENVWIGTSCENQEYADKRIPELLKCRALSPVLFLSCEPLLGKVDLTQFLGVCNERNNQIDGAVRVSSGGSERNRDRRPGTDMEGRETRLGSVEQLCAIKSLQASSSGAPIDDGVSTGTRDVSKPQIPRIGAPPSLVSPQRSDSRRIDDQSQGRGEAQQSNNEPRACDRLGSTDSCKQSPWDRGGGESIWREEPGVQADNERRDDNAGYEKVGMHFTGDSQRVRRSVPDSVENSEQHQPKLWVIAGGESGPNARPSHPDWFDSLRDQCKAADVPFFFKQVGEWAWQGEHNRDTIIGPNGIEPAANQMLIESGLSAGKVLVTRIGKKKAGRLLDGVLHDEFPKVEASR
jgi:protein gp37